MRKIKAFLLAFAMVATLSSLAAAQRDYRDDDRYRDNDDRNRNQNNEDNYRYGHDNDNYRWGRNRNSDAREAGFRNGYREGYNRGRNVRTTNRNRYGNNNDWRRDRIDDTRGYSSNMGPQGQYKKGFREGYRDGYGDAANGRRPDYGYVYDHNGRRSRWDPDGDGRPGWNNGQYGNGYGNGNAQKFGYSDGQTAGQRDRSSRHSYRPTEWEAYRDADHGMSSSNGYRSSDDYKREYRTAFTRGYDQAYGRR